MVNVKVLALDGFQIQLVILKPNEWHGHPWDVLWSDEPETFTKLDVEYPQFTYMCGYVYIYYIVLYYIISYYFISNTISYHIILYYIVLYCIALYNILYCIILYDSVNIYITILYIGLILDFLNHLPSLSGMHIVPIDWFRRGIRQETIVFTPQIVARSCLPLHQLWASWTDPYPWKIIMGNMMWMSSGWIPKANTSPRFWSVSHWFCHHGTVHQICRSQASCYIV